MKKQYVPCPVCDGVGKLQRPQAGARRYTTAQRRQAFDLFKQGYSLRAICKKTGIASPQSASNIVQAWARRLTSE